jgi:ABC-type branched-subunit amino acid transport system substrate-binding protein
VKVRIAAVLCVMAIMSAACGARLDSNQRKVALQAYSGTGAGPAVPGGTASPGATVSPGAPGSTPGAGGNQPGAGGNQPGAAACDPSGNKASDTGVTATTINIGTVSDISGVQPGLFKSTFDAMKAWKAYTDSLGGICGRQVVLDLRDDQTNSGGNRAETQAACAKNFALVGSTSAFDDGGASTVNSCGIPDMSGIAVTPQRGRSENTYAMYNARPGDYLNTGTAEYVKKTHPGVIKNAALLYLNAGAAIVSAQTRKAGYEKAGFKYVYYQAVQVVEPNYNSYVVAMKNHSPPVKYVNMVGDAQSLARLAQSMQQQNWFPEVLDFDSAAYSPQFLELGGTAAEKAQVWNFHHPFEEANSNQEMQLYLQWLSVAAPGAEPDFFGVWAWSAGRLFGELATKIGNDLTREKLFAELKKVKDWTSFDLHVPLQVAQKIPPSCFLYHGVRGGAFVRQYPSSGYECDLGTLVQV